MATTTTRAPMSARETPAVRVCGWLCLLAGVVGAAAGLALALYSPVVPVERFSYPLSADDFAVAQVFFAVHHLGLLAGLVGLALCGAVPRTPLGRISTWAAIVGMVGLTLTEVSAIAARNADINDSLGLTLGAAYGVWSTVLGVSLLALGVAVARGQAWTGWQRWVVLALGVWVFIPMFPALAVTPTDGARLAIGGWMLLFAALGLALLRPAPTGSGQRA